MELTASNLKQHKQIFVEQVSESIEEETARMLEEFSKSKYGKDPFLNNDSSKDSIVYTDSISDDDHRDDTMG